MTLSPIWNLHPMLHGRLTGSGWVQYLLQGGVQFPHAERSPVHRAENLNVPDRVEMEPFWNSLLHHLHQRCCDLFRVVAFDEMEIGTRIGFEHVGHLPSANPVRVGDDVAARSLPEHFGEPHDWHDPALDQVPEHRARSHGRKLVYVADQNQSGAVGDSPHERVHQRHVHHRGFVHDQKSAGERVRLVSAEPPCCGVNFQQAVDRLRLQARGLGEPLRRPSSWSTQQALHALGTQDHQDRVHQRRLSDARSSGDDYDPVRENRFQRLALAGGESFPCPLLAPRDRLLEINRRIDRLLFS